MVYKVEILCRLHRSVVWVILSLYFCCKEKMARKRKLLLRAEQNTRSTRTRQSPCWLSSQTCLYNGICIRIRRNRAWVRFFSFSYSGAQYSYRYSYSKKSVLVQLCFRLYFLRKGNYCFSIFSFWKEATLMCICLLSLDLKLFPY